MTPGPAAARVLFVCTANECRSPFAEAIATRAARGLPIRFESAGVDAWRRHVPSTGLAHARELGLDLSAHVSTRVHVDGLWDYDLVLGLARAHTRELLVALPELRPRLFTVKQFARWVVANPRRDQGVSMGTWLDRTARNRPGSEFVGSSPLDDVEDPLGKPIGDWRHMTSELIPAIDAIIAGLFPAPPRPATPRG